MDKPIRLLNSTVAPQSFVHPLSYGTFVHVSHPVRGEVCFRIKYENGREVALAELRTRGFKPNFVVRVSPKLGKYERA